jgi:hypothetical protein
MAKYRKSAVVEAVQVTDAWFTADHPNALIPAGVIVDPNTKEVIMGGIELKSHLTAKTGDWVILGKKTYPMHDEEFKAMYEEVK